MLLLPLATTLCFVLCLIAPIAGGRARYENFAWPTELRNLLRRGDYVPLFDQYTEQQADEFLANAMLYHVKEATEHAAQDLTESASLRSSLITTVPLYPRHRILTEGLVPDVAGHRFSRFSPGWFSMPLLTNSPHNSRETEYFHVRLVNGQLIRSLDVIRFDQFRPSRSNGFWLPTAIVRPYFDTTANTLKFKVVREFPTSAVQYRQHYRISPSLAAANFHHVLQQKQGIWLGKLDPSDRDTILRVWSRATQSRLLPKSNFFTWEAKSVWRHNANKELQDSAPSLGGDHPGADPIMISSSDDKSPETVSDADLRLSQSRRWAHAGETSNSAAVPQGRQALVEHNFFEAHNQYPDSHAQPHATHPWQHMSAQPAYHQPSWPHVESLKEPGLNLDLSLAPSSSSSHRTS